MSDITNQACSGGTIGLFNVNGTGTVTLVFSGATANSPVWVASSATYTLNPVPEPTSIALLDTGIVGLLVKFFRRRA